MQVDFCTACGIKENLHQHHLIPKSAGGTDAKENMLTLCVECHGKMHGVRWSNKLLHRDLVRAAKESTKEKLEALGLWQGTWDATANHPSYIEYKIALRLENEERALMEAKRSARAAEEFAENARPFLSEVYDYSLRLKGRFPFISEVMHALNAAGHRTRANCEFSPHSTYNVLIRLGFDVKRHKDNQGKHKAKMQRRIASLDKEIELRKKVLNYQLKGRNGGIRA